MNIRYTLCRDICTNLFTGLSLEAQPKRVDEGVFNEWRHMPNLESLWAYTPSNFDLEMFATAMISGDEND